MKRNLEIVIDTKIQIKVKNVLMKNFDGFEITEKNNQWNRFVMLLLRKHEKPTNKIKCFDEKIYRI